MAVRLYMVVFRLFFLLLGAPTLMVLAANSSMAKPGCQPNCGSLTIPFPFGMGARNCFLDDWYEISCPEDEVPRLKKIDLEVLNISLPDNNDASYETVGRIIVSFPVTHSTTCNFTNLRGSTNASLDGSQFVFSTARNVFTAVGCNMVAFLNNTKSAIVGCQSECLSPPGAKRINANTFSDCSGFDGCCQITIPPYLQAFNIHVQKADDETASVSAGSGVDGCRNASAFLVDSSWLIPNVTDLYSLGIGDHVPVVLNWFIPSDANIEFDIHPRDYHGGDSFWCRNYNYKSDFSSHYNCYCSYGFDGNPYLQDGCQDINECEENPEEVARYCGDKKCVNTRGSYHCAAPNRTVKLVMIAFAGAIGALLFLLFGRWLYKFLKRRKKMKLNQKYFKRNGGLLLQQQLASLEGNIEKSRLFNSKELDIATDKFNKNRILGQGGQGTVYKGMLTDGRIVAIKKSIVLDADKGDVEQFINEVFILSQINHRNVVKLLGCSLESEVPLLAYEFILNGTLYQYLHDPDAEFPISWEVRLRIAAEVAGALSYLHSSASIPIYHRDIKTTNILLDEKYRAKVADFGTSRSVALDQTHLTTLVQGTFGYLDPENFQSSQFTDKSDVYSFGVVLVELLTGEKPISSFRALEGRSLATYFIISMEEDRLLDILDAQVLNHGNREEIMAVANLARRCLDLSGRKRPTMREVAMELEGIRNSMHLSTVRHSEENTQADEIDGISESSEIRTTITANTIPGADIISISDTHPLLPDSATW